MDETTNTPVTPVGDDTQEVEETVTPAEEGAPVADTDAPAA